MGADDPVDEIVKVTQRHGWWREAFRPGLRGVKVGEQ